MSYDAVRFFEKLPDNTEDDLNLPDLVFMLANNMVIFDHLHHTIKIVSCVHLKDKASRSEKVNAYQKAIKMINVTIKDLNQSIKISSSQSSNKLAFKSNCTEKRFSEMVAQAKKHIRSGEIIQTVLSQRFSVATKENALSLYRSLRTLNPSPYMFLLKCDGISLIGSSPELLVRCENGLAETRPIAGTRPRGKNEQEDMALEEDLLADPKEKAEHIMLVDLGRNDLGRVCQKGTVEVNEFMAVERYSHVMHIVSNVQGKLRKDKDPLDLLQAAFPAGTLSGAPKIRAMNIIDDLEQHRRGPYGGCVGYLSFSQNLDTCITIRTIVLKGKQAYIQAGAGIVADSQPKTEYKETVNKAKAQLKAIEMAHTRKG